MRKTYAAHARRLTLSEMRRVDELGLREDRRVSDEKLALQTESARADAELDSYLESHAHVLRHIELLELIAEDAEERLLECEIAADHHGLS